MSYREYECPTMGEHQKSFYGKARIQESQDGTVKTLISYSTAVARFDNGRFVRLWDGYSATTLRHVNGFRRFCGLPNLNKAEWYTLEVERGTRK